MGTGRFHPYAVIKRAGIPLETRYWPRAVDVVDAQAPPSPPAVSVQPTRNGALARWGASEGAEMYAVIARPVPASAGEPIEQAVSSAYSGLEIALPPGRRYEVSVQAIDPELRRSAESAPTTIAVRGIGNPPPSIAGEPNPFAEVGVPWAFVPLVSDLDGQAVGVRVVAGPAGMSAAGRTVSWTPRSGQIGFREFTLEAVDSAGGRRRKTFFVNVNDAATGAPAPSRGLTVSPASVRARRTTVLTVTGQSFDRRTRLRLDGRRLRRVRFGDVKTLSVRVRCLKPGAHTISIRRADGTIESLRRGLTVVGKRCARKGGRRR